MPATTVDRFEAVELAGAEVTDMSYRLARRCHIGPAATTCAWCADLPYDDDEDDE